MTIPTNDPMALAAAVTSRADLARFVRALLAEFQADAGGGWENPTLERYLEALAASAAAGGGADDQPPTWRTFAELLAAARDYE
jgi:uncharacterized protein YdaU (DUF1376 family)